MEPNEVEAEPFVIFFAGFPSSISHVQISRYFKSFGKIKKVYLRVNDTQQLSLGSGYVICKNRASYTAMLSTRHTFSEEIILQKKLNEMNTIDQVFSHIRLRSRSNIEESSIGFICQELERFGPIGDIFWDDQTLDLIVSFKRSEYAQLCLSSRTQIYQEERIFVLPFWGEFDCFTPESYYSRKEEVRVAIFQHSRIKRYSRSMRLNRRKRSNMNIQDSPSLINDHLF